MDLDNLKLWEYWFAVVSQGCVAEIHSAATPLKSKEPSRAHAHFPPRLRSCDIGIRTEPGAAAAKGFLQSCRPAVSQTGESSEGWED